MLCVTVSISDYTRPCFLTGFDVLHGLSPPFPVEMPAGQGYIVGAADEFKPYLPSHPWPALDYSTLASLMLSFVVTRVDTNKQTWEICQLPRRRKGHTKLSMLQLLGTVLLAFTKGNLEVPPLGAAQDFHGSHLYITMAFLGLCPKDILRQCDFFDACKFVQMKLPCFLYSVMVWKNYHMFGNGDEIHLQNSWVEQLRSGIRWIRFGDLWVTMASLLKGVHASGHVLTARIRRSL